MTSPRVALLPATDHGACAACPWRVSNQGKRHPDGWYTKANIRRLWGGLRRGERMSCHPTDPSNPVPPGARPVPEGTATRECAGAQIILQREIKRLEQACRDAEAAGTTDGARRYQQANPRGLTRQGIIRHLENVVFQGLPGGLSILAQDLNDPDIGHPDLVAWVTT